MTPKKHIIIYYAHSKQIYQSSHEHLEINHINAHFPSSLIINLSKFSDKWNEQGLSENEIMDECFSLVKKLRN
jgi:hypothetical protein